MRKRSRPAEYMRGKGDRYAVFMICEHVCAGRAIPAELTDRAFCAEGLVHQRAHAQRIGLSRPCRATEAYVTRDLESCSVCMSETV